MPDDKKPDQPRSKYGFFWEIIDEVQRFVSNTSEIQFVPKSAYDALQKRCEELESQNRVEKALVRFWQKRTEVIEQELVALNLRLN